MRLPRFFGDLLRLTLLLFLIAFATTRLTLILHEFIGHGGAAELSGANVIDFRLFLFGGGWIRYVDETGFSPAQTLFIALGGVGLELLLAGLLLAIATRFAAGSPLRIAAATAAYLNLVHLSFYVGAGTHYGFGDGAELHRRLGEGRLAVVVPCVLLCVLFGFLGARRLTAGVDLWLGNISRRRLLASLGVAASIAAAVHGGAMLIELRVTSDPTYADIMRDEAEREAERQLQRYLAEQRRRGVEVELVEVDRRRRELVEEREPFPLTPFLAVALAVAIGVGAWRGSARQDRAAAAAAPEKGTYRGMLPLALVCVAAVLFVLVLRRPWW